MDINSCVDRRLLDYSKCHVQRINCSDSGIVIFYIDITKIELVDLKSLPRMVEEKLNSYIYMNDKKRMFGGLLTFLYGVYETLCDGDDEKFSKRLIKYLNWEYNEYGKPQLGNKEIFFNISHSGNYAVCCFGESDVGIDIEQINLDYIDVANTYFAVIEAHEVNSLSAIQKPIRFTELWVMKESFVKAVGMGMSIPFNSFYFHSIEKQLFRVETMISGEYRVKIIDFFDNQYKLAICWKYSEK